MKYSIFNLPRIFYFSSPSRSRYNDGGSNNRDAGKYGFNFRPTWNNAASSAVLLFYDIAFVC